MIALGYIMAVVMGAILGLLGGGGSILTVPILAYLMAVPEEHAPTYSLFVVGIASALGVVQYLRLRQFSFRAALLFGLPSMAAVFVSQRFVRPAIPVTFMLGSLEVSRGGVLMLLFGLMMLLAAWSMIRKKARQTPESFELLDEERFRPAQTIVAGLLEGAFTGLVGAGGGFIIVPALVSIAKLPMKRAVGTSLLIMSIKSLVGFTGGLHDIPIRWDILLPFAGLAMVGILLGVRLSKRIPVPNLKLAFGWLVLAMGILVITRTVVQLTLPGKA